MKNMFLTLTIFICTFIAPAKTTSNTSLNIEDNIYTQSKTNLRVNKTNVSLKTQEDDPESKGKNIVNQGIADASGSNSPNYKSQNTHQNLVIATEVFFSITWGTCLGASLCCFCGGSPGIDYSSSSQVNKRAIGAKIFAASVLSGTVTLFLWIGSGFALLDI